MTLKSLLANPAQNRDMASILTMIIQTTIKQSRSGTQVPGWALIDLSSCSERKLCIRNVWTNGTRMKPKSLSISKRHKRRKFRKLGNNSSKSKKSTKSGGKTEVFSQSHPGEGINLEIMAASSKRKTKWVTSLWSLLLRNLASSRRGKRHPVDLRAPLLSK